MDKLTRIEKKRDYIQALLDGKETLPEGKSFTRESMERLIEVYDRQKFALIMRSTGM